MAYRLKLMRQTIGHCSERGQQRGGPLSANTYADDADEDAGGNANAITGKKENERKGNKMLMTGEESSRRREIAQKFVKI
jgi:hypothetical protein